MWIWRHQLSIFSFTDSPPCTFNIFITNPYIYFCKFLTYKRNLNYFVCNKSQMQILYWTELKWLEISGVLDCAPLWLILPDLTLFPYVSLVHTTLCARSSHRTVYDYLYFAVSLIINYDCHTHKVRSKGTGNTDVMF